MKKTSNKPKIYHILHIDRLASIAENGTLWCDKEVVKHSMTGTSVGMSNIKARRLNELKLSSYPDLFVGDCVPFYFCPRSIMLYLIHQANHEDLAYKGGQQQVIHLEADLFESILWARQNNKRWVFSLSNAGSRYFEDRCDVSQLDELDWDAINNNNWVNCKDGKQAEFLMEDHFSWPLIKRIGVKNKSISEQVSGILTSLNAHKPIVEIMNDWYY